MKSKKAAGAGSETALSAEEEAKQQEQAAQERRMRSLWSKIPRKEPRFTGEAGAKVFRVAGKRQVLLEYPDAGKEPETAVRDTVTNMMLLCRHLGIDWEDLCRSAEVAADEEQRIDEAV